jgi:hypothetical protein
MSRLLISLIAAAGMAASGASFAANAPAGALSRDSYKAEKEKAEAQYKADKATCDSLNGNAKDVCVKEAKGKEKVAKAEAEAAFKNTDKARYDARMAHADADYDVAKEKCDDLKGNDKDVCVKQAKAGHVKAKADAKVARTANDAGHDAAIKTADARRDAAEDKRDADYKVAAEKCDAMSGGAKDQCVKNAKARYGKM